MEIKFDFDERGFQRAVKQQVERSFRELAAKNQREFDALFDRCKGKRIDAIRRETKALFGRIGWTASDDVVESYAQAIAAGRRIKLEVGAINW